jgi:hypothetical protein
LGAAARRAKRSSNAASAAKAAAAAAAACVAPSRAWSAAAAARCGAESTAPAVAFAARCTRARPRRAAEANCLRFASRRGLKGLPLNKLLPAAPRGRLRSPGLLRELVILLLKAVLRMGLPDAKRASLASSPSSVPLSEEGDDEAEE